VGKKIGGKEVERECGREGAGAGVDGLGVGRKGKVEG
jgi:hypothetical protein